ncbi:MAG: hypothetical protein FD177_1406 [Desulfovibrionaceae bacterium]|nr:MAG: hypothetical protein FD177_1406 [Desulfovibrionaceae bacterium]
MRLIFIDDRAQAFWLRQALPGLGKILPVAMTAEASQALDELKLVHRNICDFGDTRAVSRAQKTINYQAHLLAREVEHFLVRSSSQYDFGPQGFLSQGVFFLDHALTGVAARVHLMSQAIGHLNPSECLIFDGRPYSLYSEVGHARHPWLHILPQLEARFGVAFEVLPAPGPELYRQCALFTDMDMSVRCLLKLEIPRLPDIDGVEGLRLLFPVSAGYDWEPVIQALAAKGAQMLLLPLDYSGGQYFWENIFLPEMTNLTTGERLPLNAPRLEEVDAQALELLQRWEAARPMPPRLEAVGFDLFPAIQEEMRAMCSRMPRVIRHAEAMAQQVLEAVQPDAVCYYTLASLSGRTLSAACARRGIKTIVYQHGGGFPDDFHRPQVDNKMNGVDYMFTYGEAYSPLKDTPHPSRLRYVPVGSARLERLAVKRLLEPVPACDRIRVMWVSEFNWGNTRSQSYSLEETARFQMEKEALQILDRSGLFEVHYRPYPMLKDIDGTSRWLEVASPASVRLNLGQPFPEIIRMADLVISLNHSHTSWIEAMVLGAPMLLYFNPDVFPAPISESTRELLDESCCWCPTPDRFRQAILDLAGQGRAFVDRVASRDTARYVRECALHVRDGNVIPRVASFLMDVCKNGNSVEKWAQAQSATGQVKP